jgi:hypothetical protein
MIYQQVRFALAAALALMARSVAAEDQAAHDKIEVEAIIQSIYAKKIGELEYPSGKDATPFRKRCHFLQSIFEAPLLRNDRRGCNVGFAGYFRFPSLSDQDMSDLDDANTLPKSRIIESSVKNANAIVKVQAPIGEGLTSGRIIYFLRRTDSWHIRNILAYERWPLDANREGGCKDASGYYHFVAPPQSETDLADLPPACKSLELSKIRPNPQ